MINIIKNIEIPKGMNGGYDQYKKGESAIGFVYRVDNQSKRITIDAIIYNNDGLYLNNHGVRIEIVEDKILLGPDEKEVKGAFNSVLTDINDDKWEWLYGTPFLGETIGSYLTKTK